MLGKTKKIHFVGIGGAGMNGIAELLHNQGFEISGSDMNMTETTDHLQDIGIKVIQGHYEESCINTDVVVISSAVGSDNIEVTSALKHKIPVIKRAEMLAELLRINYGIAIAGTHGKTTTTSMVGIILVEAGLDPTVIVGGKVKNFGSNSVMGAGAQIVVEADEYDRSFLKLSPIIAGITNVEADHLDCYEYIIDIKKCFIEYANKVPFFGCIVACAQDKGVQEIMPDLRKRLITYGIDCPADVKAINIRFSTTADNPANENSFSPHTTFDVLYRKELLGSILLNLPGEHNILNALMAISIALELDVPFDKIQSALSKFSGVFRRCEYKGEAGNVVFYDDYAHHPTEIVATLSGFRKITDRRIVAVFQPHLYSRTRDFYVDFGNSFSDCDVLVVTPIYPAREKPIAGISGKLIADEAENAQHSNDKNKPSEVHYIENNEDILSRLHKLIKPGDIVMTMGAGNIYKYGEELMEQLLTNQ